MKTATLYRKTVLAILPLSAIIMISPDLLAQKNKSHIIHWSIPASLPAVKGIQQQPGVAGAFAGMHNGVLLIAGGANFPDRMPWQGGKKVYRDDIYVLQKGMNGQFKWITACNPHLKQPLAYGASTTTPLGVVCVGGETANAGPGREAFIMQWDAVHKKINFKELPVLPVALANAGIISMGQKVYVTGGETNGKVSNAFFVLDLANPTAQWRSLDPLPIAVSHSVSVAQSNGHHPCIYVLGGRAATASGISELHNETFCYDPALQLWTRLSSIGDGKHNTHLSAGTGVAIGDHEILLIGGDKGDLFHKIETFNAAIAKAATETEKQALQEAKLNLLNHHPGFSRDLYLYNTVSDTWKKMGELPVYGQVTTTAVKWRNDIFIPSGEIKPGTRTPHITMGKLLSQRK